MGKRRVTTVVTLHAFSGRPDPCWVLSESRADELAARLAAGEPTTTKPSGVLGYLGFRGFSVLELDSRGRPLCNLYIHEGIVDPGAGECSLFLGSREVEVLLLATADDAVAEPVREHVLQSLARVVPDADIFLRPAKVEGPRSRAADAPRYEPRRWNDHPTIQHGSNCYAYANNQVAGDFPQPGYYARGQHLRTMDSEEIRAAACRDGLLPVFDVRTDLDPGQGWYVALAVAPGWDYHWYRQDESGRWSHKPGRAGVTDLDNSGNLILDPRQANRGPYTEFCSYLLADRRVRIAGPGR